MTPLDIPANAGSWRRKPVTLAGMRVTPADQNGHDRAKARSRRDIHDLKDREDANRTDR